MKECIFWDSEDKKFISWAEVSLVKDTGDDFVIVMKEIDNVCSEGRNFESFDYIGQKDINKDKIYADCSIVEFEIDKIFSDISKIQKGYFSYNADYLCYDWVDLTNHRVVRTGVDFNLLKNIKIIDTIQENKLGLTK